MLFTESDLEKDFKNIEIKKSFSHGRSETISGRQEKEAGTFFVYTIDAEVKKCCPKRVDHKIVMSTGRNTYAYLHADRTSGIQRPVVVGGPASLFCACYLARAGLSPAQRSNGRPCGRPNGKITVFLEGRYAGPPESTCSSVRAAPAHFPTES